jgi:hypothetical protein
MMKIDGPQKQSLPCIGTDLSTLDMIKVYPYNSGSIWFNDVYETE